MICSNFTSTFMVGNFYVVTPSSLCVVNWNLGACFFSFWIIRYVLKLLILKKKKNIRGSF